jgi:hypothetical protein
MPASEFIRLCVAVSVVQQKPMLTHTAVKYDDFYPQARRSVLFTGTSGVGKTAVVQDTLSRLAPPESLMPVVLNFSAQTTSIATQVCHRAFTISYGCIINTQACWPALRPRAEPSCALHVIDFMSAGHD